MYRTQVSRPALMPLSIPDTGLPLRPACSAACLSAGHSRLAGSLLVSDTGALLPYGSIACRPAMPLRSPGVPCHPADCGSIVRLSCCLSVYLPSGAHARTRDRRRLKPLKRLYIFAGAYCTHPRSCIYPAALLQRLFHWCACACPCVSLLLVLCMCKPQARGCASKDCGYSLPCSSVVYLPSGRQARVYIALRARARRGSRPRRL